jgi:hypothetical protein
VPTRAELYRQRATECETLAERANDADRKFRLREAAKQWADLAERVEQLDATKGAAEPDRYRSWQYHPNKQSLNMQRPA